jgi:hypothetical protein
VAAHLGDETGAWSEGTVDAGEHGLLAGESGDPVEGGVREDGVELVMVGEGGGVVLLDLEAVCAKVTACGKETAFAGGGEHGGGSVDASDDGSDCGELFSEGAVAAAEVEDLFAGLGVQKGDNIGGEGGDEAAVGGVGFGVPGLAGLVTRVHRIIVPRVMEICEQDKNFRRVG